jgi:hypothetical protein
LIFLAFIVPVAIYCLILSMLNRSQHPIMVAGPWDFAGVLFAASGLLLVGGPAVLTGLYEQWRMSWLLGQTRFLAELGDHWYFWLFVWGVYFIAVLAGAAMVLRSRCGQTSIYNVDPVAFDEILNRVLELARLHCLRDQPGRLLLRHKEDQLEAPGGWLELKVETSPAMHHVTLHWNGEAADAVRPGVEAEMARELAAVESPENSLAGWFLSAGLTLFFVACLGAFALMLLRVLHLPR